MLWCREEVVPGIWYHRPVLLEIQNYTTYMVSEACEFILGVILRIIWAALGQRKELHSVSG